MVNYSFVAPSSNDEYFNNDEKYTFHFYQICSFKNPRNNKYHVRKCKYDQDFNLISINELYFDENMMKRFEFTHRVNKYKKYPVYSLKLVDLPNPADILQSKSSLLNNDSSYSGFATWDNPFGYT